MSELLTPSMIAPTASYAARATLAALGIGLVGAGLLITAAPDPAAVPAIVVPLAVEPPRVTLNGSVPDELAPSAVPTHMVFRAGGVTYVALAALRDAAPDAEAPDPVGLPVPRHGAPVLVTNADGYAEAAIAPVRDAAIASFTGWRAKRVQLVGPGTACEATVTHFAVVSRLVGDPTYAGEDASEWTAATMFDVGHRVLAAAVTGCTDPTSIVARDLALPAMIPVTATPLGPIDPIALAATGALVHSAAGAATAAMWAEQAGSGTWQADAGTHFRVWRMAHAGEIFVVIHASSDFACGLPTVNALGVYRHGAGGLVPVAETTVEQLSGITGFADVDRDGVPEVLGTGDLGLDTVVLRANGEILEKLSQPFFGCPC